MNDILNIYKTYNCINHISNDYEIAQLDPIYGWRIVGIKNPDISKS